MLLKYKNILNIKIPPLKTRLVIVLIINSIFYFILIHFLLLEFALQKSSLRLATLNKSSYIFLSLALIFSFLLPLILIKINKKIIEKNKIVKYVSILLFFQYYITLFLLIIYYKNSRHLFDFTFFWHNKTDALTTITNSLNTFSLIKTFITVIFILIAGITATLTLKPIKIKNKHVSTLLTILILGIFLGISFGVKARTKPYLMQFTEKTFSWTKEIERNYNKKYEALLNKYASIDIDNISFDKAINDFDIYFIHLESVNGLLVNKETMPNAFEGINDSGFYFNNFYSNTVQTMRAEESILCAVPPSLDTYLMKKYDLEKVTCLPKILDKAGYKSYFFKSHDLEFGSSKYFANKLGFSEILSKEIMKEKDPQLKWGYREDIFYQRTLEYLKKDKTAPKFVYIATSSTGHYPFDTHQDPSLVMPTEGRDIKEKLTNNIFLQDHYLAEILNKLKQDGRKKYVFIYSDNSWPIGIHKNNIFNENNAYQENFQIPLFFIPINDDDYTEEKTINQSYSQIDIFNTVLDLVNLKDLKNEYLGNSFYDLLNGKTKDNNCLINIQPYNEKYLSFFKDNKHYIYNIFKEDFFFFNIDTDPLEKNPIKIKGKNNFLNIYNECTDFLQK
jgi:hypothetical protein